jgi:hypothetical protein
VFYRITFQSEGSRYGGWRGLVEPLNCYRKNIEADGGSQNYRGEGEPHVPLPEYSALDMMDIPPTLRPNARRLVGFPTNGVVFFG